MAVDKMKEIYNTLKMLKTIVYDDLNNLAKQDLDIAIRFAEQLLTENKDGE